MDLVHCIYCSGSAQGEFGRPELDALLETARRNNAKIEVTGVLLYQNCSFFQILEGERVNVEALFRKISGDKRHNHVTKLIVEPIGKRDFGAWTMGYPAIDPRELAKIPGLNDFYAQGRSYREIGEGRAKTLLAAFKDGKWRQSLG